MTGAAAVCRPAPARLGAGIPSNASESTLPWALHMLMRLVVRPLTSS